MQKPDFRAADLTPLNFAGRKMFADELDLGDGVSAVPVATRRNRGQLVFQLLACMHSVPVVPFSRVKKIL